MMLKSKLKLEKELKREERHKEWIRKKLRNTDMEGVICLYETNW